MWYDNTTVKEKTALQRIIKTAQKMTGAQLPSMETLYTNRCRNKIKSILHDPHHPSHNLFRWKSYDGVLRHHLPETIRAKRKRFHNSFTQQPSDCWQKTETRTCVHIHTHLPFSHIVFYCTLCTTYLSYYIYLTY